MIFLIFCYKNSFTLRDKMTLTLSPQTLKRPRLPEPWYGMYVCYFVPNYNTSEHLRDYSTRRRLCKFVKSLPSIKRRWSLFLSPSAIHQFKLLDHASESRSVVYAPAFAGTDCVYPRTDGQAELTCTDGMVLPIKLVYLQMVNSPISVQTWFCWRDRPTMLSR